MGFFNITNIFVSVYGYQLSYVEFIGTLSGLFSVYYAVRSNLFTWPIGLLNTACFFVIFFQVQLYADMLLQVYFFVTSIYGWVIWNRPLKRSTIDRLTDKQRIKMSIAIALFTFALGMLINKAHILLPNIFSQPASYPFIDSLVAVSSIVATVLLAQKKLENWILWICIDLISVVLYVKKGVLFIACEYAIFLLLAILGSITWLKQYEKRIDIR